MSFLKKVSFAFLSCFLFFPSASYAESITFDEAKLTRVKAQNMGKQWLMLLWSVDCPPCFKELAIIQKLQSQHDDLAVVIINTDDNDEIKSERKKIIEKFELSTLTNFHFVDGKGDQSRFFIDPNWYGELPRSYFVESNGKFHGKSGLVNKPILMQWLVN
ncbi:MAG: redoxin domain-containing protein [Colwellia sp.]|nr:redoxin domain-containing protein [Colwellia sp.]